MIGSHSSRAVYVCAAVAAGCLAAFNTQAQVKRHRPRSRNQFPPPSIEWRSR